MAFAISVTNFLSQNMALHCFFDTFSKIVEPSYPPNSSSSELKTMYTFEILADQNTLTLDPSFHARL